jgi:hypothetical protein
MKRYSDLNLFTIHLIFCIIHLLPRKGLYQFETHCDIETWHHDHVWQAMTVMSRRTFAIFLSVSVSVTQYHPTVTVQYCMVHSPLSYCTLYCLVHCTVLYCTTLLIDYGRGLTIKDLFPFSAVGPNNDLDRPINHRSIQIIHHRQRQQV